MYNIKRNKVMPESREILEKFNRRTQNKKDSFSISSSVGKKEEN